ncbi:hypothetical protein SEVIR_6G138340v4 [Setaria viridis]
MWATVPEPIRWRSYVETPADQLLATLTLSRDSVERVPDTVSAAAAPRGVAPPQCTSLVAALGFVWSCYQRSKDVTSLSTPTTQRAPATAEPACTSLIPVDAASAQRSPWPQVE